MSDIARLFNRSHGTLSRQLNKIQANRYKFIPKNVLDDIDEDIGRHLNSALILS